MRIGFISTQARSQDGWGRYTSELIQGLRRAGHEAILISANAEIDPALADLPHYPILPMPVADRFSTPRSLALAPRLRALLHDADLIHCVVEPYAPLAALLRRRGQPLVLSTHGPWAVEPLKRRLTGGLFRWGFSAADAITCNSGVICRRMQAVQPFPQAQVICGGVNVEPFARPVEIAMPEWVGRDPYVMSAGAVKTRKGMLIALEAVAHARRQIPNLRYVAAGSLKAEPDYVALLRRRAAELDMSDALHLLGPLDPHRDLIAWYQRAAVFVLASLNVGEKFEGLGLVYLEAQAAGTPAIGPYDCGAEEAIAHQESGLLVPQNDPAAVAEAILTILGDRERFSAGARRQAERLSWANFSRQMSALYEKLRAGA